MPTYTKVKSGTAHGAYLKPVNHVAPRACFQAGKSSKMPSLLKWAVPTGKTALIKVGPRVPKLQDVMPGKLRALAEHFNGSNH
jgi:hypothetical protein